MCACVRVWYSTVVKSTLLSLCYLPLLVNVKSAINASQCAISDYTIHLSKTGNTHLSALLLFPPLSFPLSLPHSCPHFFSFSLSFSFSFPSSSSFSSTFSPSFSLSLCTCHEQVQHCLVDIPALVCTLQLNLNFVCPASIINTKRFGGSSATSQVRTHVLTYELVC